MLWSPTRPLEDRRDLVVPLTPRVRERRHALAVGKVHLGPCLDEQAHDLGVPPATAAEDDRLQERRPAEAVDVVNLDLRLEQPLHDAEVAAVGGTD